MKILVLNGPNLNLLGIREPGIYGNNSYSDLCALIREKAARLGVEVCLYQSNHEGDLVDRIQQALGQEVPQGEEVLDLIPHVHGDRRVHEQRKQYQDHRQYDDGDVYLPLFHEDTSFQYGSLSYIAENVK